MNFDWIEVSSDVIGFLSAVILAIPARNVLTARRLVHKTRIDLIEKFGLDTSKNIDTQLIALEASQPHDAKTLLEGLSRVDARAGRYEPADSRMFHWGSWMLVLSFLMKCVFHFLK
jgi:hypothetical protein